MTDKTKKPTAEQTELPLFDAADTNKSTQTKKPKTKKSASTESAPATDLMKVVATKAPVRRKIDKDFSPAEAKEIRRKIKEERIERAEEMATQTTDEKERRERAIRVKKIAREMERGNNSKVILFPSYSRKSTKLEWYKMGNFSALYFTYRMADRMGRTVRILKDTDKFAKMDGVVSIRDINKFIEQTKKMAEFERYEETLDGLYIFYLKRPLEPDEMSALRRTESERKSMMHNVLRPKKADPAVYQAILDLDRQVLPRTARMEKGYAVTIGNKMAETIMELTEVYFNFAKGYVEPEATKLQLLKLVERLKAGTALLGENAVWGYDVALSVGTTVATLGEAVSKMKMK